MTTMAIGSNDSFIDRSRNTGSSDAALKIKEVLDTTFYELKRSFTWNPLILLGPEINEIVKECYAEDWDGEHACPISQATYSEAIKFIENLPIGIPLPEVIPEPEGDIGFEWNNCNKKVFAASVNGTSVITYAGYFSRNRKTHGVEDFHENIPKVIIDNIRRTYR